MNFIKSILIILSITSTSWAEEAKPGKPVYITKGVLQVEVINPESGKTRIIKRNQDRSAVIDETYARTSRGKIHPMNPFKPHKVETVGELEVIDYIKQLSDGDDSIRLVDTRKQSWYEVNGHIPLSINIPAKIFKREIDTIEIMEDEFGVQVGQRLMDFSYAKTLVMYCIGPWCGKTPSAIKLLLSYGYPAEKLKYYRGGMQSWKGLGLTVINIFNR